MFNRKKFNEKAFNAPSYIFKPEKNVCVVKIGPSIKTSGINKGHLMTNINNAIILDTRSTIIVSNKSLSKLHINTATYPFKKIFANSCVPVYFVSIPKNTRCIFYTDKVHGNYKNKHSFNTDPLNKVPFNGKGSSTKLGTFNINFGVIAENAFKLPNYVITTQYFNMDSKARIRMHEQLDILPMIILDGKARIHMHEQLDILPMIILDGKARMEYKEVISLETIIALMADYWAFGWREVYPYKIIWRRSR